MTEEYNVAWYAAHILMRIRYRQGPPEPHYLVENVVLFEACDPSEARARAQEYGRADSNEGDVTFTCDERPAYWAYAGVRMVMESQDPDQRPTSGTEITYLKYRATSAEDVERLVTGESAHVEFG
jgi:hypothetical protein